MQGAVELFSSFVALACERHVRHMRFALLAGLLIALLLWKTEWITLRPALFLLLIGQAGTAAILFNRRMALSKTQDFDQAGMLAWFDSEAAFVKYLSLFENGVRTIGLMVLACGFWIPTRNLGVALALGVMYPVSVYFGMARRNVLRTAQQLRQQKSDLEALFHS